MVLQTSLCSSELICHHDPDLPAVPTAEGAIWGCRDAAVALAALPRLLGGPGAGAAALVQGHLQLLEHLVVGLGPQLRGASTEELTMVVGGCAGMRWVLKASEGFGMREQVCGWWHRLL